MLFNKKKRLFPCCSGFFYEMCKYKDFQDELRNVAHMYIHDGCVTLYPMAFYIRSSSTTMDPIQKKWYVAPKVKEVGDTVLMITRYFKTFR